MSKRSGCRKFLSIVVAVGLGTLGANRAQAGFTTIQSPFPGEKTQAQVLSNAYGGNFSASGLNLTNGSITARRINDSKDQTLFGDIESAKTLGVFAAMKQGLAYGNLASSVQLFNVTGKNFNATGSVGAVDLPNSYEFIRTGDGQKFSSKDAANSDGQDHLITYKLSGNGVDKHTYVFFWEDVVQRKSDFDFNDLAVEVKAAAPVVVPLPAAVWSGLATLAGTAFFRFRNRCRVVV